MSESQQDKERRERLAELRRNAGHSQESLAEAAQASRSSIYRWERGEAVPHPRQLASWADALGLEPAELNEILWSGSEVVRSVSPEDGADAEGMGSVESLPDAAAVATEDASIAADIIDLTEESVEGLSYNDAVLRLLGIGDIPADEREQWRAVIAMPSFQGANSIEAAAPGYEVPSSFIQAEDDISNDYFFGKRDVTLANKISSALTTVGFPFPLYVDDKTVWRRLSSMSSDGNECLVIEHEGDPYNVDMLIVVGLWSNLLATGVADWPAFPEYQMVGDPNRHFTRTIRIASDTGLRILDLNASDEADEMGGNPAVLINRRLADLHLVVAGGATSLSTLRLSELLTDPEIWIDLAGRVEAAGGRGSWLALECPNAARWKDRCRLVGSGTIASPIQQSIAEIYSGSQASIGGI